MATVIFGTAYASASRQRDIIAINCASARGHHDLALVVNNIAEELGLPIDEPLPEVPLECSGS